MTVNRRAFLKLAAGASGTLVASRASANAVASNSGVEPFGVLVDTTFCIGCRKCELGCNQNNRDLPRRDSPQFEDKRVFDTHRRPDATSYTVINRLPTVDTKGEPVFAKAQCMHCVHPACASACIVGALQKTPEGPVTYDAWKCIGCRYCMVACPFQIPAYEYANALTPQVRKCTFCYEQIVTQGSRPGCVANCPNEALTFGKRSELIELAHAKIATHRERYIDHVYGETEIGGTSFMYLSAVDFKALDLPEQGDTPTPALTEKIQHGVFKGFVPPVALYGLLGLVYLSRRKEEVENTAADKDEHHE